MKNLIILSFSLLIFESAFAQSVLSPAPENKASTPLEIEVTDVVADDSSMMVSIKIGLDGRQIDRFFFEDEDGTIVFVREMKDTSGIKTFNCRVAGLESSRKYNWFVKVHTKSGQIIRRIPFTFETKDRPKKRK